MQVDFHHAVTYVCARLATFSHEDAATVAYAAQHVDDAVFDDSIRFDNGALYTRIGSAHRNLNPLNLWDVGNHLVWLPFHFLPGNGRRQAGQDPDGRFIEKLICRPAPDSFVAQDLVQAAFQARTRPNALERLGITLHVFADTFAHQGFAGVIHRVNSVEQLTELSRPKVFHQSWFDDLLQMITPDLGHANASVFPDMPFLTWCYRNGRGEEITRNNTEAFCLAAQEMCKVLQCYQGVDPVGIPAQDLSQIHDMFETLLNPDGTSRHQSWCQAIASGAFTFGAATVSYDGEGTGSWKALALGSAEEQDEYPYEPAFLDSPWKRFHDALQEHRLAVLHDILPRYGICAG